jgi:hypothetical protein
LATAGFEEQAAGARRYAQINSAYDKLGRGEDWRKRQLYDVAGDRGLEWHAHAQQLGYGDEFAALLVEILHCAALIRRYFWVVFAAAAVGCTVIVSIPVSAAAKAGGPDAFPGADSLAGKGSTWGRALTPLWIVDAAALCSSLAALVRYSRPGWLAAILGVASCECLAMPFQLRYFSPGSVGDQWISKSIGTRLGLWAVSLLLAFAAAAGLARPMHRRRLGPDASLDTGERLDRDGADAGSKPNNTAGKGADTIRPYGLEAALCPLAAPSGVARALWFGSLEFFVLGQVQVVQHLDGAWTPPPSDGGWIVVLAPFLVALALSLSGRFVRPRPQPGARLASFVLHVGVAVIVLGAARKLNGDAGDDDWWDVTLLLWVFAGFLILLLVLMAAVAVRQSCARRRESARRKKLDGDRVVDEGTLGESLRGVVCGCLCVAWIFATPFLWVLCVESPQTISYCPAVVALPATLSLTCCSCMVLCCLCSAANSEPGTFAATDSGAKDRAGPTDPDAEATDGIV